jgi:hypothetical protein
MLEKYDVVVVEDADGPVHWKNEMLPSSDANCKSM